MPATTTLYNHLDDQSVWFHSQHLCSFEQTSAILWRRQDSSSSTASDGGNKSDDASTKTTANKSKTKSVQQTWQWCQHFVVPLNLCPWAPASVAAPGAMQFYVVPSKSLPQTTSNGFEYYYFNDKHELEPIAEEEEDSSSYLTSIVYSVAERFAGMIREFQQEQQLEKRNKSTAIDLAKVAIAFVILEEDEPREGSSSSSSSFEAFYNWFIRLEDYWIDQGDRTEPDSVYNLVTLAAFHPQWEFGGNDYEDDDNSGLDYEKRSPHPTISLVWTDTIHAAGQEATERIAAHNEHLLQNEMTFQQIKRLYDEAIQ